jgi:hypothetical protein
MNTRAKFTVVALFSVFAFASNPAKADVLGFSGTLPNIGAVTAEVAKIVAADVTSYLRNAISAPRIIRTRQSPTVTVHQVVETAAMETVTVVATRLPPAMETVTVVATRLPPLATETLAQANTRTRL